MEKKVGPRRPGRILEQIPIKFSPYIEKKKTQKKTAKVATFLQSDPKSDTNSSIRTNAGRTFLTGLPSVRPPPVDSPLPSPQTTKAFLPRMLELQHGHVVCINSILSQSPIPGAIDYCTSKASSLAFMESLTLGLLDCPGVGCTTVLPFHTNTEMFQGMRVR